MRERCMRACLLCLLKILIAFDITSKLSESGQYLHETHPLHCTCSHPRRPLEFDVKSNIQCTVPSSTIHVGTYTQHPQIQHTGIDTGTCVALNFSLHGTVL